MDKPSSPLTKELHGLMNPNPQLDFTIRTILILERESQRHADQVAAADGADDVFEGQVSPVADGRTVRDLGQEDPPAAGRKPKV